MKKIVPFLLVSLLPFACSEEGNVNDLDDGGLGGAPDDDASALGGAGDTGGTASGGSESNWPTTNCDKPTDLGVRIVGRHDGCVDDSIRFSWSGAGFVARIDGTGLRFTQSGNSVRFAVIVDGEEQDDLTTGSGEQSYEAVTGLPPGEHTIEVYRQSEASFGTSSLRSVEPIDGKLLEPSPRPERSIEIFGDSVTTGYGNEGESSSCSFSLETQNFYLSYGARLARGFDAEVSTVAYSGRGVVRNYDGQSGDTIPELFDRAVAASRASVWDYSLAPEPDLVLINLGTNDYSTNNDPEDQAFVEGYVGLLELIRLRYPEAEIFGTVGPLLSGSDLRTARKNIEAAVAHRLVEGDEKVHSIEIAAENPSPGCDYHPDLATHERMAGELGQLLGEVVGWEFNPSADLALGGASSK